MARLLGKDAKGEIDAILSASLSPLQYIRDVLPRHDQLCTIMKFARGEVNIFEAEPCAVGSSSPWGAGEHLYVMAAASTRNACLKQFKKFGVEASHATQVACSAEFIRRMELFNVSISEIATLNTKVAEGITTEYLPDLARDVSAPKKGVRMRDSHIEEVDSSDDAKEDGKKKPPVKRGGGRSRAARKRKAKQSPVWESPDPAHIIRPPSSETSEDDDSDSEDSEDARARKPVPAAKNPKCKPTKKALFRGEGDAEEDSGKRPQREAAAKAVAGMEKAAAKVGKEKAGGGKENAAAKEAAKVGGGKEKAAAKVAAAKENAAAKEAAKVAAAKENAAAKEAAKGGGGKEKAASKEAATKETAKIAGGGEETPADPKAKHVVASTAGMVLKKPVSALAQAQMASTELKSKFTVPQTAASNASLSPGSDVMSSASTVFMNTIQQMANDMTAKVTEAMEKFSGSQGDIITFKGDLVKDLQSQLVLLKTLHDETQGALMTSEKENAALKAEAQAKNELVKEIRDKSKMWQDLATQYHTEEKELRLQLLDAVKSWR